MRFDVYDTGVGMEPEELEELEKPYNRNGNYDGQGLGLSIVQQLCDEHELKCDASSVIGRGTVFHMLVPSADG